MSSEIKVDTISEKTSAAGVTIDGVLLKDGNVDGVDVSAITQGITGADQWRWTTNVTASEVLADSWSRPNGTLQGSYIGTGMVVDSSTGAWTFPSTGIWRVEATMYFHVTTSSTTYLTLKGVTTDDNFSTQDAVDYLVFFSSTTNSRGTVSANTLVDITDTSNDKVKFEFEEGNGSGQLEGSATENRSYVTFTRLGDT
jgi:hypothetical protein